MYFTLLNSKLNKFQYRDCHIYIVHSVLGSPRGLSLPSILHSSHVAVSTLPPCPNFSQITSSLLFSKDHLIWPSLSLLLCTTGFVSPHISPDCLLSQNKVTLILFTAHHPSTHSHSLQELSLLLPCSCAKSLSISANFFPLCLTSAHFPSDLYDNVLTLFLLCAPFQILPSTIDLVLKRVVLNPASSFYNF